MGEKTIVFLVSLQPMNYHSPPVEREEASTAFRRFEHVCVPRRSSLSGSDACFFFLRDSTETRSSVWLFEFHIVETAYLSHLWIGLRSAALVTGSCVVDELLPEAYSCFSSNLMVYVLGLD
jgi:hypothetical protein